MAKKSTLKQYPVKMEPGLWTRLKNRAEDDKRSVNQTLILAIEKFLDS